MTKIIPSFRSVVTTCWGDKKGKCRSRFFFGFLLACALPPVRAAGPPLDATAQAAWSQRDKPGEMKKAIDAWRTASTENPSHPELLIPLAKACSAAYRHSDDKSEKLHWAQQALDFGEQASAKNPDRADAQAYYAEALGQYAQAHKGFSSLTKVKQAVAQLKKALAIDPHYAYAHMLLAEFYRSAPASISVGDKVKSLEEARLAVRYGPGVAINHLTLAQALLANGLKAEGERQLLAVLSLTPPPDQIPETHSDQETARELLKGLGISPHVSEGHTFDEASCKALGGQWGPLGRNQESACNFPTHEGHKTCNDPAQCQGACVADSSVTAGQPASGQCAGWTNPAGTCENDVVNGKAMGTVCIE